jgi:hypothetical protein
VSVLIGIALLIAGPAVAAELPPGWIVPASIGWLALAAALSVGAVRWSHRRLPWIGPSLLFAAGLSIAAGFGRDWEGAPGTRAPCRRNWGWLPSWLLRSSPTHAVWFRVGPAAVKVCYGAPRARGRKMIGGTQVPYGHLWRTGANEPTTIRTSGPLSIGGIPVEAGKASIYTIPGPETWEIILNRSTRQWGVESEYTAAVRAQEIGRTIVPSHRSRQYQDVFTITVEPGPTPDSAVLVLGWESTLVRIPVAAIPSR